LKSQKSSDCCQTATDSPTKAIYLGAVWGVKMRKVLAIFAIAALMFITPAKAQKFSNTIFFGDSNTDTGWFLYKPLLIGAAPGNPPPGFGNGKAPAGAGTFTTNPDPGWAQIFANKFGYAAIAADTPVTGGNNWAIGGARVVASYYNTWSTQKQLAAYLASTGGIADPNAIFTYWIGVNDLQTNTTAFGPYPGNIASPQNVAQITLLASQEVSQIAALRAAGARYILVPNVYDLGPAALAATNPGAAYDAVGAASRNLYSQLVWNGLAAQGINFIPADVSALRNFIATNPALFGITVTSIKTGACGNVNSYQCTEPI
jgi:outer membrane lipase/esterase